MMANAPLFPPFVNPSTFPFSVLGGDLPPLPVLPLRAMIIRFPPDRLSLSSVNVRVGNGVRPRGSSWLSLRPLSPLSYHFPSFGFVPVSMLPFVAPFARELRIVFPECFLPLPHAPVFPRLFLLPSLRCSEFFSRPKLVSFW